MVGGNWTLDDEKKDGGQVALKGEVSGLHHQSKCRQPYCNTAEKAAPELLYETATRPQCRTLVKGGPLDTAAYHRPAS